MSWSDVLVFGAGLDNGNSNKSDLRLMIQREILFFDMLSPCKTSLPNIRPWYLSMWILFPCDGNP